MELQGFKPHSHRKIGTGNMHAIDTTPNDIGRVLIGFNHGRKKLY